jgi:hypothetical protein
MKPDPDAGVWPVGILLTIVLQAACIMGKPISPPPAVQPSAEPVAAPRRDYPPPFTGSFWWPDQPEELPPKGFDKLKAQGSIGVTAGDGTPMTFEIAKFTLAAPLPGVPAELPVYRAGAYQEEQRDQFKGPHDWVYPSWSEVATGPSGPIPGEKPDPDHAAEQAALLLRQYDLLMPDNDSARVYHTEGATLVTFFRHINGMPLYNDRGPCVSFGKDGSVQLQVRRQPLMQRSLYPVRSAQEAWQELLSGHFIKVTFSHCEDGGPQLVGKVADFRVTSVELAYWEPQPNGPGELVQPYYVFRNGDGATLYVPAVKPEWLLDDKTGSTQ